MLQQQPQRRASGLPLIALAATVVLAVVLPIAGATAGPAGSSAERQAHTPALPSANAPASGRPAGAPVKAEGETDTERDAETVRDAGTERDAGPTSNCGGEITSPEGLTAQTCVMSEGQRTWARTYYRNTSGSPLRAALTLTRPDGGSVRVDCEVPASREPGMCETPRERSRAGGQGRPYTAITEAGSRNGERLLLRSGSNSP